MTTQEEFERANDKVRRAWRKRAPSYDKTIGFFERRVFGSEHRRWACAAAEGETLEVAVGTGLNLPLYNEGVRLTGIDLSPEMLAIAGRRAEQLAVDVDLREADAHRLPFADSSFDTVVCTYSLCNIPDAALAVTEMGRVLRPSGKLVLVDHIRSPLKPVLWIQKAVELFTGHFEGEHMTRRPLEHLIDAGFEIDERQRLGRAGIVERVVARPPTAAR